MITKSLPCTLTPDEIRIRGQRLATLRSEIRDIEAEKKAANADFKDRIESRDKECSTLIREINSGKQYREVQVEEEKDWEAQCINTIRVDTREVVDVRAMTPRELQRPILFDPPAQVEVSA